MATTFENSGALDKAANPRRFRQQFSGKLIQLFSLVVPIILVGLIIFLAINAWPAMKLNGFSFLTSSNWNLGSQYGNPITVDGMQVLPGANYAVLFLIFGTLVSSFLALLFAIPVGLFAAMFLNEIIPSRIRESVALLAELLASVPSVVFGLWGYVVVIPVFSHYVYPVIASVLGFIPFFAAPVRSGYGMLTAGIVLALMVVPIITANMRDAISAVSSADIESAFALGSTRFEMIWKVVLPQIKRPLIGVSILGLGRAMGETMAVLMVSGNALHIPKNIYSPMSTMASFLVSQLSSAMEDPTGMAVNSLVEIGLLLLILGVLVNAAARLLLLNAGKNQ